ncbi:MAG: SUMF1/EgtB/PvdO family nonheme iron enzyme [Fimbriimonadaceae bacterium]|nr:SUMF1/EgtB/PvdO family nonheme iron enzyme [Fimbriimonadaceae bacterium]
MLRSSCVVWCWLLTASWAAGADPSWYRREGSWHETMLAARLALSAEQAAGHSELPDGLKLGVWQECGPLFAPQGKTSYQTAYPPQQGVQLQQTVPNGRGQQARWAARPNYPDGQVNNLRSGDASATFLYRTLTVPTARPLRVYLGSDDGLAVWLNGVQVHGNDVPRGCAPNQDVLDLALRAGRNELLLKVCNQTGGYAFYFSTTPTAQGQPAVEQLWRLVRRDFATPGERREQQWESTDAIWTEGWPAGELTTLAGRYAAAAPAGAAAGEARRLAPSVRGAADLWAVARLYATAQRVAEQQAAVAQLNLDGLHDAIVDLRETYGPRYPGAAGWLARLSELRGQVAQLDPVTADEAAVTALCGAVEALRSEALLANPLLDFERLLLVRRAGNPGLPQNWQGNCSMATSGYDNSLQVLSPVRPDGQVKTLYQPPGGRFVGDLNLHWSADRLLFSMPDSRNLWQVWELPSSGGEPRQVTPADLPDVHSFTGCYLPDGRIIYSSTACYQGVPCVGGGDKVSLLYLLDPASGKVRQLTFDQDHSWYPTVLNSGRVIYTRWEYGDSAHYFTRLLFSMNPDGTNQTEFYGSNSYWPNSLFYARPVPGSPTKVAAIVSGHHGVARQGELVILDVAQGRREANGAVQRIPGRQQPVEPKIVDQLVNDSWPRFLHPWPLSAKYLLASGRRSEREPWGIYLVDTFDNLVLLRQDPSAMLLEPVPLRRREAPPAIPDKVKLDRSDATVYVADVYSGPGLVGVPRGSVKSLRVYSNHFAYPGMGGHINVGIDGPWDVKRILGTVPVAADGSVYFRAPANTPLAVEPCDDQGQALALMRSWMTAMPGEALSCVGCHETQNTAPPRRRTLAASAAPAEIAPWHGPARGFSFTREVQPVLDRACVGCHDGAAAAPDLRDDRPAEARGWSPSYVGLHPYVRRPGPESDYHLLTPTEFTADTSELVQLLRKGHHNVRLTATEWDRLITWIDLNVPSLGTWSEEKPIPGAGHQQREAYRLRFAGLEVDHEQIPTVRPRPAYVAPEPLAAPPEPPLTAAGFPCDSATAQARQAAAGAVQQVVELPGGLRLELQRVPAGSFVMGDATASPAERPRSAVDLPRAFWMARCEITNAQFATFDPAHDSRYISETNKDQTRRGVPVNQPQQPVVRVSQQAARAFCEWLSRQTGRRFRLPTEAEWEYACRAGSAGPTWYGDLAVDFGPFANLADRTVAALARANSPKWMPRIDGVSDGQVVTAPVGSYRPNPWGLCDLIGNAAEWTSSDFAPYPYRVDDGGEAGGALTAKVVRGGSWYDRPYRATAAWRLAYPAWRQVYNVGFRVVADDTPDR